MNDEELIDNIVCEAECWCSLNLADPEDMSEEDFAQCITVTAASLDLNEEDVEYVLKEWL